MLQLKNISKEYITGDLHQVALNKVNISFRDKEFCSILGPSGSGKSTLLNIIGGLDVYDDGDLIIDDISTKKYTDKDWDSYRNHTIGFVFQSYNLIPHQNVLSNVELALTISGVSKNERKQRAIEALEKVGLGDQIYKKPNQLSGGQMQRVAIARALVNNPDILLADEPTGALDTKTSVQIMELLKEVAEDRLVIMVTHNPELAKEYSTRIVELKDGKIVSDSKRYLPRKKIEAIHQNMGKSFMSFATSLSLSFNNLRTKLGRTFLTAFAGSIGIVGIALILGLSNGVNTYIRNVQEDTMSEYPLSIFETGMDLSSLIGETMGVYNENTNEDEQVRETKILEGFLSGISTNDLKSFKEYLDNNKTIQDNVVSIEYSYPVTPLIYKVVDENDIRKVNPDETFSSLSSGGTSIGSFLSMSSSAYSQFKELPKQDSLYKAQYDVLAGKWPENKNELVMVLTSEGNATDYSLYVTGLKNIKELDELLNKYKEGEQVEFETNKQTYSYSDFLGKEFYFVDASSLYEYDKERNIYVDKSKNIDTLKKAIEQAEKLTIVGVVKANGTTEASMLSPGIGYTSDLVDFTMKKAQESEIVKKQIENPEINIFSGNEFGKENNPFNLEDIFSINEAQLNSAFGFDFSALDLSSQSFKGIDFSDVKLDIDANQVDLSTFENIDYSLLLKDINIKINYPYLQEGFKQITDGFIEYAKDDPSTNYSLLADSVKNYMSSDRAKNMIKDHVNNFLNNVKLSQPTKQEVDDLINDIYNGLKDYASTQEIANISDFNKVIDEYFKSETPKRIIDGFIGKIADRYNGIAYKDEDVSSLSKHLFEDYEAYARENFLPEPSKMIDSFNKYIQTEEGKQLFNNTIKNVVNVDEIRNQLEANIASVMNTYSDEISSFVSQMMSGFEKVIADKLGDSLKEVLESMQNVFYFNADAFSNAIDVNMDSDTLKDLMMSMATSGASSYSANLRTLNYATEDSPSRISIYPRDFDSKTTVIKEIDRYNSENEEAGEDDKIISYSDTVATLMGSVTKIVNTISYILIAFVAISLVVSSIMIGIITYISVLERTKEIGILRALGASKQNVSQVFNAETFIIGLLAGILGILISYAIMIPANVIIHEKINAGVTASLQPISILMLIGLSTVLTLIGGLIPAKTAAKLDPVVALRTE